MFTNTSNDLKYISGFPSTPDLTKRPHDSVASSSPDSADRYTKKIDTKVSPFPPSIMQHRDHKIAEIKQSEDCPPYFSKFLDLFNEEISKLHHEFHSKLQIHNQAITKLEGKVKNLEIKNSSQTNVIQQQTQMLNNMQYELNKTNLIFQGIEEVEGETVSVTLKKLFKGKLGVKKDIQIVTAFRMGKQSSAGPIKVIFGNVQDRNYIWSSRKELKGSKIFISEDLPLQYRQKRSELAPYLSLARNHPAVKKSFLSKDQLYINGKPYSDIKQLPYGLSNTNPHQKAITSTTNDQMTAFFGWKSPFSNHHPCLIKSDGIQYTSSEQFYFHKLAIHVNDPDTAQSILQTTNAREVKKLSHRIKNYKKEEHRTKALEIMQKAVELKFTQNEELKTQLLENEGELIECNPTDMFWSCGLSLNDQKLSSRSWEGQNHLGRLLCITREKLRNQDA